MDDRLRVWDNTQFAAILQRVERRLMDAQDTTGALLKCVRRLSGLAGRSDALPTEADLTELNAHMAICGRDFPHCCDAIDELGAFFRQSAQKHAELLARIRGGSARA